MSEDKTAQLITKNTETNSQVNQLAQQQVSNAKQASVNFAPLINLTPTDRHLLPKKSTKK